MFPDPWRERIGFDAASASAEQLRLELARVRNEVSEGLEVLLAIERSLRKALSRRKAPGIVHARTLLRYLDHANDHFGWALNPT